MPTTPTATDDVPVLVPRRADGGRRDHIWKRILEDVWQPDGWHVVEGHHDGPRPFNRSAALNTAAQLAGHWQLAVIADADSLVDPRQLAGAIDLAAKTGRLVIAHSEWVNVTLDETDHFLASRALRHDDDRTIYRFTVSSMLVVPRHVWDTVHGFDERFTGWGCEDQAFARCCRILTGEPERMYGPVFHLDHDRPRADVHRQHDSGYLANRALWRRYQAAKTPAQMRDVRHG